MSLFKCPRYKYCIFVIHGTGLECFSPYSTWVIRYYYKLNERKLQKIGKTLRSTPICSIASVYLSCNFITMHRIPVDVFFSILYINVSWYAYMLYIILYYFFVILQAIIYEGQDKNPEMCRVLLTHEVMCR